MDMKKILFSLLMLTSLQVISGQDRIITIRHDTIHCRIISISPAQIHYEQKAESGFTVGKFIPTEQVLEYLRNANLSEIKPNLNTDMQKSKPEFRWMASIYSGGGYLLASTAEDEKEMKKTGIPKSQADNYIKKLKHGWSINGDIHCMFSDNFGMGARYSLFKSSVQQDFTIALNSSFPEFASVGINEKQYTHFVGPSMLFRQWLDKNRQFQLTETFSAGYVSYRNETRLDPNQYSFVFEYRFGRPVPIYNILAKGKTWGANVGLSAGYFPLSWLSVGVNTGFTYARLTKFDLLTNYSTQTVELDKKEYQYLTRFDYSLNIRFHF